MTMPLPESPRRSAVSRCSIEKRFRRQEAADAPTQAEALGFWREALADMPPRLPLPFDRARPERPSGAGGRVMLPLHHDALAPMLRLAREERTTPFVVLLSAFAMFLHRWCGAADIPIGTPVAGRHRTDVHDTIGLFVNTVVTRFRVEERWSLRDAVAAGRTIVFDGLRHQAAPFEAVVEAVQPSRAPGESPIFQVMFALQTMTEGQERLGPSRWMPLEVHTETAKFDLTAFVFERPERTEIALEFNRDVFHATTIEAATQAFIALLENSLTSPDVPLAAVRWLADADRQAVLAAGQGIRRPYPSTITAAFASIVARRGDAVAIDGGSERITYTELAASASAIASALQQRGVNAGDHVGIVLPRGAAFVTSILGVLQAGAGYVPIDLETPPERIRFMLDDAGTRLVLVAGSPSFEPGDRHVVDVATLDTAGLAPPAAAAIDGDSAAYVMYTSGSTGDPKGIAVPHQAITRLVLETDYCQIEAADRVAQAANVSFDAATFEIWGALLNGATLVMLPADVVPSARLLVGRLRSDRVSVLFLTTSLFNRIAFEQPGAFATLRALLFGGEAADVAAVRRVVDSDRPPLLLNVYGPTEATTFATASRIETVDPQALRIPIGKAIANTSCYVLDARRDPVPFGVPGELYIGGDGLALGYLRRPDLTEKAFVADPFTAGGRLYKTGDRCRMHPDGTIEFIERLDRQVKLRGFRIEPAEVERALSAHRSITGSVVDVIRSGVEQRLVAWVTTRDSDADPAALRTFLMTRLPGYLVPSTIVMTDRLPLTPSGKIDRAQLPAVLPDDGLVRTPRRARDPLEAELVKIWEDVLQTSPIGTDDNFFELGGHSLLAAEMIDRVETLFERRVPISALMSRPTIEALATEYWHAEAARGTPLVPVRDQGDRPPLFFVHGDFNGGGLYCSRIARRLHASQPFYVLALHGVANGHVGLSIQSIAAEYADLIRRARPTGPIALGGYCYGALVAFEVARLLSRDREVTNVLMVHPSPVEPRLLTVD